MPNRPLASGPGKAKTPAPKLQKLFIMETLQRRSSVETSFDTAFCSNLLF
jgi:hypothetical protein